MDLNLLANEGSIDEIRNTLTSNLKIAYDKTQTGDCLLHLACHKANLNLVRELLKMKVDVNVQNRDGMTPLMLVTYTKIYPEFQERLVEGGPLALMMHLRRNELQVTKENIFSIASLLLENSADPNITSRYQLTAFKGAFQNKYMNVCKLLIENKADTRIGCPFTSSKGTFIMDTDRNEDFSLISKLFYYGPHPDVRWMRRANFIIFLVACGYRDICGTKTSKGVKFVSIKAQITHEENVRKNNRTKMNQKMSGKIGKKEEQILKRRREKIFCEEGLIRLIASFL